MMKVSQGNNSAKLSRALLGGVTLCGAALLSAGLGACDRGSCSISNAPKNGAAPLAQTENASMEQVVRTDEEWKQLLTPLQYNVLREKGTERAFSGKYWDAKTPGEYRCAGCGEVLFVSDSKFDSGCGWPSFDKVAAQGKIIESVDGSHGMVRTEVTCAKCGGHLGHLFNDGPTNTGMRYCINSASIELEPDTEGSKPSAKGK